MQVQQSTQREELVETLVSASEGTLDRDVGGVLQPVDCAVCRAGIEASS